MVEKEERNRKLGLVVSGGFHMLLILAFLFIIAWREPDPPVPEYGIELNFGMDNVGSGDIQPTTPAQSAPEVEEAEPEDVPEENIEEVVNEETPIEQVAEAVPVEEVTTENTQESPDVVKEITKPEEKPVVEEKPVEKPTTKPVDDVKPEKPESGAKGEEGEQNQVANANQGDNNDKVGDKGSEQGTLDSRALYGEAGGGGGSALDMSGWTWDFRPTPNDQSNDNGRIVFEIKIDDQGEIISIRTLERSVSPDTEKIYKAEVQKLTFSKTSDNSIVAPTSTGKITFIIKSK